MNENMQNVHTVPQQMTASEALTSTTVPTSENPKQPLYKKWWIYVIVVFGVLMLCGLISICMIIVLADIGDEVVNERPILIEESALEEDGQLAAESNATESDDNLQIENIQDAMYYAFGMFDPIEASGSGDSIVRDLPGGIFAVIVTHDGTRNFAIHGIDDRNDQVELLVNAVGTYSGTVLAGDRNDDIVGLSITADGSWTITVVPIGSLPELVLGEDYIGDQVRIWHAEVNDLSIVHSGERNFAVRSISARGTDLLVNQIGDYSGVVLAPAGFCVIEVVADGTWSISSTD